MSKNIIVDGIIDAIKELREIAKCPFCDGALELEQASTGHWGGRGNSFTLTCPNCKLDFSLTQKKDKWFLEQVRRSFR